MLSCAFPSRGGVPLRGYQAAPPSKEAEICASPRDRTTKLDLCCCLTRPCLLPPPVAAGFPTPAAPGTPCSPQQHPAFCALLALLSPSCLLLSPLPVSHVPSHRAVCSQRHPGECTGASSAAVLGACLLGGERRGISPFWGASAPRKRRDRAADSSGGALSLPEPPANLSQHGLAKSAQ